MKYTITVEVEDIKTNESFLSGIFDEINEEKRQLDLTYAINKETTKLHRKILEKLVEEVNSQLKGIAVFGNFKYCNDSNHYSGSIATAIINNDEQLIKIKAGCGDPNFKASKYLTYTGKYQILVNGYYVNNANDVLNNIRCQVKSHILKYDLKQ